MAPKYIFIVGTGRSGTHWVCNLLNVSSKTYCRNEAHRPETSPLTALPSPYICHPLGDDFGEKLDQALAAATLRMSERDQSRWSGVGDHPKVYLYEWIRASGINTILGQFRRHRVRQILSRVMPGLWPPDWPVPWWLADRKKLQQATVVFQFPNTPGWAEWILNHRTDILVIHIVRHPGGFLKSWRSRYASRWDDAKVKSDNETTLRQIAQLEPEWAARFGAIDQMSMDESKLWYWCYLNEKVATAGRGKPNYVRVVYEDLVANTVEIAHDLYDRCGVPWTADVEAKVTQSASNASAIATAWKKQLSPEQIELVERALQGSFMRQWWQSSDEPEFTSVSS